MEKEKRIIEKNGRHYFYRLSEIDRKHHNLMFLLMFVLFLTGFPLRFYAEWWAPGLYTLVGGPRLAPTIHRFAGLALTGLFLLHILMIARTFLIPRIRKGGSVIKELLAMEMVPNLRDIREMVHHIMYLLYLKDSPPEYGRMTWREKLDYLALYRGIPMVALTGLLVWQGDLVTRFLPGIFLNVAHLVHSYEVTLILLSVVGFHWYNVHYSPDKFPMSHVFITGYATEDETVSAHYDEYREAMRDAGKEGQIKVAGKVNSSGLLERVGYKLFTLFLLLFFIWFTAIAVRYIFYNPSPAPLEKKPVSGFHSESSAASADKVSGCVHCHTDIPHAESNGTMEPFLNMHSSFLACETCHKKGKDLLFRWYDPVTGDIAANPSDRMFMEKRGDYRVKIASGEIREGKFVPFSVREKDGEVLANKRNHRSISKSPLGCPDCHKKDGGYLPLGALGYPDERISKIKGEEGLAVIERYRKVLEEEQK